MLGIIVNNAQTQFRCRSEVVNLGSKCVSPVLRLLDSEPRVVWLNMGYFSRLLKYVCTQHIHPTSTYFLPNIQQAPPLREKQAGSRSKRRLSSNRLG